jgi:DNA repair exonuclease SbcCD ATPase subunit
MTNMGTKILSFEAQNTRVLKCVRIAPDANSNLVIIGGDNGAGKTTVLDDIDLIFSGAKKSPALPIRVGQTEAKATVKLSNGMEITREWDAKGTRVTIRGKDGKKVPGGAQGILDAMFSSVAFDPLEFADRMDQKKQAEVLRGLVGLDFSELEAKRAALYSDRENSGRDLRAAEGQLSGMVEAPEGTPDEEVSIKDVLAEKEAAERANARADKVARDHADAVVKLEAIHTEIERLEKVIKDLAEKARPATDLVRELDDAMDEATSKRIDVAPIRERLANVETVNRSVRAKNARAQKLSEVDHLRGERQKLTESIEAIDAEKSKKLAAVKWPVEGLGFDTCGVTYKGVPFAQASKAERYKVSVAIGAECNPELHVMLARDASLLDNKTIALLSSLAAERDLQLWMERVGDKDPGAIILEDGEIKA